MTTNVMTKQKSDLAILKIFVWRFLKALAGVVKGSFKLQYGS